MTSINKFFSIYFILLKATGQKAGTQGEGQHSNHRLQSKIAMHTHNHASRLARAKALI